MINLIVIDQGAESSKLDSLLRAIDAQQDTRTLLVGKTMPDGWERARFIDLNLTKLSSALQAALAASHTDKVFLIDSRAELTAAKLQSILMSLDISDAGVTYFAADAMGELVDIPELSEEAILKAVMNEIAWPGLALAIAKEHLPGLNTNAESLAELTARIAIHSLDAGPAMSRGADIISVREAPQSFEIRGAAASRLLALLIEQANIEDMFRHHDWANHQGESAAAAYHTLAALFIRFGDNQSALNCLKLSDKFEDSPRSLALKGIIALDKGEVLGAVANIVASLQSYESRKKSDSAHYLTFEPQNLETINKSLNEGLEALNSQKNEAALQHFAEAVFNFDGFYKELGVAPFKQKMN